MLEAVSPIEIAVQGLKAQRTRINVIANNIANVNTTRTSEGGAFRRQMAIFRGYEVNPLINPRRMGVRVVDIVADPSPLRTVYEPNHPDADADGYVSYPNVNIHVEMTNLVSAQRGYDANIAVITSSKRMTMKALEIIQP